MPTAIRATAGGPSADPAVGTHPDPFTATAPGARHAVYARLAERDPVHRIALPNGAPVWRVTGHGQVRALLTDPRLVKAEPGRVGPRPARDTAVNSDLQHADPPDHTRLRRLVSVAFTRRRVAAPARASGSSQRHTTTTTTRGERP